MWRIAFVVVLAGCAAAPPSLEHPCVDLIPHGSGRHRYLAVYKNGLFHGPELEPALADDPRALPLLKEWHREIGAAVPLLVIGTPLAHMAGFYAAISGGESQRVATVIFGVGAAQLIVGGVLLAHGRSVRDHAVAQFNARAAEVGCR